MNLAALARPMSLFGLTDKTQADEIRALQSYQVVSDEHVASIKLINVESDEDEDEDSLMDEMMADYVELEYFAQSAQAVAAEEIATNSSRKGETVAAATA